MAPELASLLPPVILLVGGGVELVVGAVRRAPRFAGAFCMLVLLAACTVLAIAPETGVSPMDRAVQWGVLGIALLFALAALERGRRSEAGPSLFATLSLCGSGVMLVGSAGNLILMFLALELAWLPLLLLLVRSDRRSDAAGRFLTLGMLSTLVLLYGLALLYGVTGSVDLVPAHETSAFNATAGAEPSSAEPPRLGVAAMILVVTGLGMRMALAPFHLGRSEFSAAASAWDAGLLAVFPTTAATLTLIRLLHGPLVGYESAGQLLLSTLAGLTMIAGGIIALTNSELRRVLSGFAMAYAGLVVAAVAVAFWEAAHPQQSLAAGASLPGGVAAALFGLGSYALLIAGLICVVVYLAPAERQIDYSDELAGLIRTEPAAAACAVVLLLGLAGLPLLPGFWARLWMLLAALSPLAESGGSLTPAPHRGFVVLAVVVAVGWLLLGASCVRIVAIIVLESPRARPRPTGGQAALAAAVLASLLSVGIGLLPGAVIGGLQELERHARGDAAALAGPVSRTLPAPVSIGRFDPIPRSAGPE